MKICNALINTLRSRRNGRRFADDTFKRICLNENVRIAIKFSLKFVPKGPINNISTLVQIMAWRRSGNTPLSEPMMVSLLTHLCVTRPQWVKSDQNKLRYSFHRNIQVLSEDQLKSCLCTVHVIFVFLFALKTSYEFNNHAVNQTPTKPHRISWLQISVSIFCFRKICHCAFYSVPKLYRKLPS